MIEYYIDKKFLRKITDYMQLQKPRKKIIQNYDEKLPIITVNTGGII